MNNVPSGQEFIFVRMILPCGRLIAPGTWPLAYIAGLRTSRRTKSAPLDKASCTSQQSVSKVNSAAKCSRAMSLGAAGISATTDFIRGLQSQGHADDMNAARPPFAIGANDKIGKYHANRLE